LWKKRANASELYGYLSVVNQGFYLGHTTGFCSGHSRGNVGEPLFDQLPTCFRQHDDRDLAISQVLLMSDVSV
jgi:hypothetical protein